MYIFWFDNQQVMRQLVNISLEVLKLLSTEIKDATL